LLNEPKVTNHNKLLLLWLPICAGNSYSTAQHFNFGPCDPSQKIQAEHFIASAPSPPGAENPSYATGHATLSPGQSPLTGAAAAAAAAKAA